MINFIYEKEEMNSAVLRYAQKLCAEASEHSLKLTKSLISHAFNLQLKEFLIIAAEMNADARSSEDCQRGISAFLNKEKILW